jgi:hypothetical protein
MLGRSVLCLFACLLASAVLAADQKPAEPEPAKIGDAAFVGNYFAFYNPKAGTAGTLTLTIDVDEFGNYIEFLQDGTGPVVTGTVVAADGKWKLSGADGKPIDEGTYMLVGPQIHLTGAKGSGVWSKVAPQSKQAALTKLKINPKAADVTPFIAESLKKARADWAKDAVVVEVQTVPNPDGTFDLTPAGGNLTLRFFSKSTGKGCWGRVNNWGETELQPEERAISPSRWGVPTNVIAMRTAYATAKTKASEQRIVEATLWGAGEDPDLRQFCWIFRTETGVVAVDAVTGELAEYAEFRDGRERARTVPFSTNAGIAVWSTSTGGAGGTRLMWFRRHVVFLDGFDEAIVVRVPVKVITEAEMMRHAIKNADGSATIRGDKELYPLDGYRPMDAAQIGQFLKDPDAIAIDCAPKVVETVEPLSKYPRGTRERIKRQLESHWRAGGGR